MTGIGDQDGVFKLAGMGAVLGHGGPVIGENAQIRFSIVDHRLDSERHILFQFNPFPETTEVQDLGLFMKIAADTVAAKFSHHGIPLALNELLDGRPDIPQAGSRPNHGNASMQGFYPDLDQFFGFRTRRPHKKGLIGVSMKPIQIGSDIEIYDIPIRSEEHTSELQSH